MEHIEEHSTSIYHDTVSIGGGAAYPHLLASQSRNASIPSDNLLIVDISSATSDKNRVLFNIHTKTTLPEFKNDKFEVVRSHDEFIWLHDHLLENDVFAGLIVPPPPTRPDFESSQSKLQRVAANEGNLPKSDMQKLKLELEAEYLATFKKTVATHEVFLKRLADHPTFRHDPSFRVFLEFDQELSVRNKTRKEKAADFFKSVSKSADETLRLTNQKDEDHFFREEKTNLANYHSAIKEVTATADLASKAKRSFVENVLRVQLALGNYIPKESSCTTEINLTNVLVNFFEDYQKILVRICADEDLKLSDTMRYYASDTGAARDLLYRRSRAMADFEAANRLLDKARARMKDVQSAEDGQIEAGKRFKSISESAKLELEDFKIRRVRFFQKNLVELAELEMKHTKSQISLIKSALDQLRNVSTPIPNDDTTDNAQADTFRFFPNNMQTNTINDHQHADVNGSGERANTFNESAKPYLNTEVEDVFNRPVNEFVNESFL